MCKYFPVWLIYAKEWFIYRIDLFFFLFPESRIMITKEREGERMRKKLIFLDLDGTLWHGDHQIPQSTLDAIETARRNGHKVFSNTGRSQAEVPKKLS